MFLCFTSFADQCAAISNINLVNKTNLDKVLKAEVFIHNDKQLRAAHLILGYDPISSNFQAPKCVIKARDPHLHQINVAVPGFLIFGPIPECVLQVKLPSLFAAKAKATPSKPIIKEEEGEEIVDVLDSKDDYEVFKQSESSEIPTGDPNHLLPTQVSHK